MLMHDAEMTMSEVLRDPMIRLMLRADRVPLGEFAKLLENTARTRDAGYAATSKTPPRISRCVDCSDVML
jgi:hypothetical protein